MRESWSKHSVEVGILDSVLFACRLKGSPMIRRLLRIRVSKRLNDLSYVRRDPHHSWNFPILLSMVCKSMIARQ